MVKFIQYDERYGTREIYIKCSYSIESFAKRILNAGGTFKISYVDKNKDDLIAFLEMDREIINYIKVKNGPRVPVKINDLISKSYFLIFKNQE